MFCQLTHCFPKAGSGPSGRSQEIFLGSSHIMFPTGSQIMSSDLSRESFWLFRVPRKKKLGNTDLTGHYGPPISDYCFRGHCCDWKLEDVLHTWSVLMILFDVISIFFSKALRVRKQYLVEKKWVPSVIRKIILICSLPLHIKLSNNVIQM